VSHSRSEHLRLLSLMHIQGLHLLSERIGGYLIGYAYCLLVHPYLDLLSLSAYLLVSGYRSTYCAPRRG